MLAIFMRAKDFENLIRETGAGKKYFMAGFPNVGGQVTHAAVVDGVAYLKMSPLSNPAIAGKGITINAERLRG